MLIGFVWEGDNDLISWVAVTFHLGTAVLLSSQCPQCRGQGQICQCPLPPLCPRQTCSSTSSSPLMGDIGVVAWPSGREQMGTRHIQWFSIWLWVQAGVFWFVLVCSCIEWVYSQMRELF